VFDRSAGRVTLAPIHDPAACAPDIFHIKRDTTATNAAFYFAYVLVAVGVVTAVTAMIIAGRVGKS
jgi:hypothetical protein